MQIIQRNIVFILFPLFWGSCQFLDKQIPSKEDLLNKELKTINWKEVDEYPSVEACEKIEDKTLRQKCFFEFLAQAIQQKLNTDTLPIAYSGLDTLQVRVTVFPNATIQFEPQFPDSTTYDTVKMDSILQARLIDFPVIHPALKRGIPVKTQFILPVVLKSE